MLGEDRALKEPGGLGVAYELWHLGGFAIGPSLQYRHLFSDSLRSDVGVLAARVSYYTGP